LEVIFTHLTDSGVKELVKRELSQRYYLYYLGIIQNPQVPPPAALFSEDLPQVSSAGALGEEEPAQVPESQHGAAGPSLSLEETLANLTGVTPIKLAAPDPAVDAPGEAAPGKPAKKKRCFIATAAYGTAMAPEVVILQDFRDHYLGRRALGERIIEAYYRLSPPLARQIEPRRPLRRLTRLLLAPVIFLVKKGFRPPASPPQ
jgi:hypothetical protein